MFLRTLGTDLRQKALWCYESDRWPALLKVLLTDGTPAMVLYRLMQWSRRWRLAPLEMVFNKLNAVFCNCLIGRGAEFGPGLVLIHATGIVINGRVRGGSNLRIEHQVTEQFDREVPSKFIGRLVMRELRRVDQVAYVRFASVYRDFKDVTEFVDEIRPMLKAPKKKTRP